MGFDSVPLIQDSVTTLDANGINPSLNALIARTDALKNHIDNLTGSCGLIFTDTGFDSTVSGIGTLVAWDRSIHKYVPASAAWSGYARDNGSVLPADSSYVVGVLVSDIGEDGYATIMANGWTSEPAVIYALTGDSPTPGPYYLSTAGKAVHAQYGGLDMDVPVYCFTYTATGKIIIDPRAPEQYGHSHSKYTLTDWSAVEGGEAPAFMTHKCVPESGSALAAAVTNYPQSCALYKNGIMLSADDWTVAEGVIYTKFKPQATDEIFLFITIPSFGYSPLIHSVYAAPGCDILNIENNDGNVKLSLLTDPVKESVLTGESVVRITKAGIETGPSVQALYSGAGVEVNPAVDADNKAIPGVFSISADSAVFDQRDMQVCNLDGVLFGVDDTKISYKFPAGVVSSLYGTFRLPHFDTEAAYGVSLNLIVEGSAEGYSDLTATITPISATADGAGRIPSIPVTVSLGELNTVAGMDYLVSTDLTGVAAKADSLLLCRIQCNNGNTVPLTVLGISVSLKHK